MSNIGSDLWIDIATLTKATAGGLTPCDAHNSATLLDRDLDVIPNGTKHQYYIIVTATMKIIANITIFIIIISTTIIVITSQQSLALTTRVIATVTQGET